MNQVQYAWALLAVALAGCVSMAPTYQRPAAPVPAQWPTGDAYGGTAATANAAADVPWRQFILDERLQQVIDTALGGSRSLREQIASVESARAQYRVQRAARLPEIDASVNGTKARNLVSTAGDTNTTAIEQSYSASISTNSWEIDLFGRLKSLSDEALHTYLATEATARAARISLIAETATAWFTLAADRDQLHIAQQTMQSAEQSLTLTRSRLEHGVASAVDVAEAETTYQSARSGMASYATIIAQDRNALELLVGGPIPGLLLPDGLARTDCWLEPAQPGIQSDVLLRRPDVIAAEQQLKAANADIGAMRAAFFPSVTLTSSAGVASDALSNLVKSGARVWSIGPSVTLPLFTGGKNRANLDFSKSQKLYYIAAYELALQNAFEDVANTLARQGTMNSQLAADRAYVEAAGRSYQLAEARYKKGVDTFLNVLISQRTLYTARSRLATDEETDLNNQVALYKALGGGLRDGTPERIAYR